MKKLLIAVFSIMLLFQTKAQNVSVNYVKEFVSDGKSYMTNKNFAPYAVSGVSVNYSKALKSVPVVINVAAVARTRKPPMPRYIPYPDPPVIGRYAVNNNIEADSASFAASNSRSIDVLVGAGYIIPNEKNRHLLVTINADFGVALNNNQAVNYYLQGKLTGKAEVQKTQFIINPNIQAKYFFNKNIGLNLIAGYNNRGGANVGAGIVFMTNKKSNAKKCIYGVEGCTKTHIKKLVEPPVVL